jgi:hypothetical protein
VRLKTIAEFQTAGIYANVPHEFPLFPPLMRSAESARQIDPRSTYSLEASEKPTLADDILRNAIRYNEQS